MLVCCLLTVRCESLMVRRAVFSARTWLPARLGRQLVFSPTRRALAIVALSLSGWNRDERHFPLLYRTTKCVWPMKPARCSRLAAKIRFYASKCVQQLKNRSGIDRPVKFLKWKLSNAETVQSNCPVELYRWHRFDVDVNPTAWFTTNSLALCDISRVTQRSARFNFKAAFLEICCSCKQLSVVTENPPGNLRMRSSHRGVSNYRETFWTFAKLLNFSTSF